MTIEILQRWLKERFHVISEESENELANEFERWVKERGITLSEVQRAWARGILNDNVSSTYFLAFTGFGKTTIIRLLSEFLSDKDKKVLIVTQAGAAKQLKQKIEEDHEKGLFNNKENVKVVSYQTLSAALNKMFKTDKTIKLMKERFNYIFIDDLESVIDDLRTISLWKLFVLRLVFPMLTKPKVVRLNEVKQYIGHGWRSYVNKWVRELYRIATIELNAYELKSITPSKVRDAVLKIVKSESFDVLEEFDFPNSFKKIIMTYPVEIVKDSHSLDELFRMAHTMNKEEFKEKVKEIIKGVIKLSNEVDRAWKVIYGIDNGVPSNALLFLKRLESSEWYWSTLPVAKVVVSSASFSSSSSLWGFLLGLRGAVSSKKTAYFNAQVNKDLIKVFVRKEEVKDVHDVVEKVLDVWNEIDFKSNVLVFIDTGLFDEKEVKKIIELGNEELAKLGLNHMFVRVSSDVKGFFRRGNYAACNVEWLTENAKVAGGEGPYMAIVGSAAPNSPIVRGLDLPGKAPVAVFIGVPSIKISVEVPENEKELAAYLVRSVLNFVNVEKIVRAYAEVGAKVITMNEINDALKAVKGIMQKVLEKKDENRELAKEVAKGEKDFEELIPFDEIKDEVEKVWKLVEKVRGLGVDKIEKYTPNVTVLVQALGRTARALMVKDGKVLYHKGMAIIYEWRKELLDFLERSVLRN